MVSHVAKRVTWDPFEWAVALTGGTSFLAGETGRHVPPADALAGC